MTINSDVVVAILGTGGVCTIGAAVITGLFSKRRMGAEATEIITKAAAGVVTNMQNEIDRQEKAREQMVVDHKQAMQTLCEQHEAEMNEVRRVLQLHVAWDAIAIAKVNELGVSLPAPPPLLPPTRIDHDDLGVH